MKEKVLKRLRELEKDESQVHGMMMFLKVDKNQEDIYAKMYDYIKDKQLSRDEIGRYILELTEEDMTPFEIVDNED